MRNILQHTDSVSHTVCDVLSALGASGLHNLNVFKICIRVMHWSGGMETKHLRFLLEWNPPAWGAPGCGFIVFWIHVIKLLPPVPTVYKRKFVLCSSQWIVMSSTSATEGPSVKESWAVSGHSLQGPCASPLSGSEVYQYSLVIINLRAQKVSLQSFRCRTARRL